MTEKYLRHTWVSPKLTSGKSKIHGSGFFAIQRMEVGEKVMEFGGEPVLREQVFSGNYRSRSIWIIDEEHFLALPNSDKGESLDENINHSCDANTWLVDEVTLVAKRDIAPGEEITLDQGTWNFEDNAYTDNKEPCSCGTKTCRKILTENDWEIPSIQEKYKGHFHPIVEGLISKR